MSANAIEILITNAIHAAFIKYPEGDGGPYLDYEWIAISGSRTPCLHRRALGCAMVIRAARLAAISAAGRPEQAHKAVARLRQLNPALSVSTLKDVLGRVTAAPAREHLSQ